MINILIPSMGKSLFFKESYFPKPMIEVDGETMLEKVVGNYETIKNVHYIFAFGKKDCSEFHLDESAKILTDHNSDIIVLDNETAGALCTCLMSVALINNENPLIIANSDQIIDVDYNEVLDSFEKQNVDAGVITFESVHPRWSYANIINNEVVEVAEKRPLSKNAIAGFYYFRHGADFVEAAKQVILKRNEVNGKYYISSAINEVILKGKKVGYYEIARQYYHSFYSPDKIKDYERFVRGGKK